MYSESDECLFREFIQILKYSYHDSSIHLVQVPSWLIHSFANLTSSAILEISHHPCRYITWQNLLYASISLELKITIYVIIWIKIYITCYDTSIILTKSAWLWWSSNNLFITFPSGDFFTCLHVPEL
jgi:hypothetical protein